MAYAFRSWIRLFVGAALLAGAALGWACAERAGGGAAARDPDLIVVDIAPMRGLLAPVVRDGVEIRTLVPGGASPHGFALRPSDAASIRSAAAVVHVGGGLSPEIRRAVDAHAPSGRVVSMADALGLGPTVCAHGHDHAHDHDHDHGGVDPHLWVDPERVRAFLAELGSLGALGGLIDPGRLETLEREVAALEARAASVLERARGARIVTQHHAFTAWLERHGIGVVGVVRDGVHLEPSPESVAALAERLRSGGVDMVFVEPQFPGGLTLKLAAESGVRVGVLDPLGEGDWLTMMHANLDALAAIRGAGDGDG